MKVENIMLSPALAEEMLRGNVTNRHLSEKAVNRYAKDMLAGNWKANGESIKISKDGRLLDGQHRLHAVAQSGCMIPMVIVRGVEESAVDTIDIGKKRSFGDWLGIQGEKNTTTLAAGLSLLEVYKEHYRNNDFIHGHSGCGFIELEKILEANPQIRISAAKAKQLEAKRWFSPSVLCVAHYLFQQAAPHLVDDFFHGLSTGINLGEHSPILTLRNMSIRWTSYHQKPKLYEMLAYLIHAWNAYVRGKTAKNIRFNPGDPFPTPAKKATS